MLTKRGNSSDGNAQRKAPDAEPIRMAGFAPAREFYAPRYDQPRMEHNRPDFRPTLHWAPSVQTNVTGKATVRFFASDATTTVRVDVRGAHPLGGVGEATFRVEP